MTWSTMRPQMVELMLTLMLLAAALTNVSLVRSARAASPQERAEKSSEPQGEPAPCKFRLNVVGPNGAAISGASIRVRATPTLTADQIERGKLIRVGKYDCYAEADGKGALALRFPCPPTSLRLRIQQAGYGPYWASWNSSGQQQSIPQEFTAELDKAWSVGGVVVDNAGLPVEGAQVSLGVYFKKPPGDAEQLGVGTSVATDSEGKWQYDHVPVSKRDVSIACNHPAFGPLRIRLPRDGFAVKPGQSPSGRIEIKRGLKVTGEVTDVSGAPIRGALVRTKFLNDIRKATTDEFGKYRLTGCEPGTTRIVVSAKGRATEVQEVSVDPNMQPVNFSMKPGGRIRIRVVDEQGRGIPKARIFFQRWRGKHAYFEFDHVPQFADANGVWQWNEAPLDEFTADICRPGGMQISKVPLIAREEEYVFTPARALVVSGRVVDAKTGKPINQFRVTPGLRNSDPRIGMNWIPGKSFEASQGIYRVRLTHDYPAHLVRIEAEGYRVAISRDIMTDEGEVNVDFRLQGAEDIAATIVSASGNPAEHAKIALGVAGSQISVDRGDLDDGSTYATRLDADANGRFSFPARDEPFQIVITHPSGFAHYKSADGPIPKQIVLTEWARVEGTFRVGVQPAPNVVLWMSNEAIHSYGDDVPSIFIHHEVTTGADGSFVFERVFPGRGSIARSILRTVDQGAKEITSSHRVRAKFVAGKTTTIHLGGKGRPVVGRLTPPAEFSENVKWSFAEIRVQTDVRLPRAPRAPEAPEGVRDDAKKRSAWLEAWKLTDDGKAWAAAVEAHEQERDQVNNFSASVDRDGTFRIDDMPAGKYTLSVRFSEHAPGRIGNYSFEVPPMEERIVSEPMDLGILELQAP